MDLLEPHIKSGLGVSFKADNGRYVSVIGRSGGKRNIEAEKSNKDPWTKFTIVKIDEDRVYLKASDNQFLSRINRGDVDNIEAEKQSADQFCKFQVFEADKSNVIFKADNGRFLSRIYRDGQQNIEAAKDAADAFTRFGVETGSVVPVKEEIVSISWGDFNAPADMSPTILETHTVRNGGSEEIVKEFTFEKDLETNQETTWESSWGVTSGVCFTSEASIDVGIASAKTSVTLNTEVRYDGRKGGNKSKKETLKLSETTKVSIAPHKEMTIKFMVKKIDNAEVPFTATIKRTSELGVTKIQEKGHWKRVMVLNSYLETETKNLEEALD